MKKPREEEEEGRKRMRSGGGGGVVVGGGVRVSRERKTLALCPVKIRKKKELNLFVCV